MYLHLRGQRVDFNRQNLDLLKIPHLLIPWTCWSDVKALVIALLYGTADLKKKWLPRNCNSELSQPGGRRGRLKRGLGYQDVLKQHTGSEGRRQHMKCERSYEAQGDKCDLNWMKWILPVIQMNLEVNCLLESSEKILYLLKLWLWSYDILGRVQLNIYYYWPEQLWKKWI